jgi:hypothetical protein
VFGLWTLLAIAGLLCAQVSWAASPKQATSSRGVKLTPEEIQANRILEKKMQLLKELRARRDRCVAEVKARQIIIDKAQKDELTPQHLQIKSLQEKESALLKKLPVNTSSGTYQVVSAKLAEVRKELAFLTKRHKERVAYWQKKSDEMGLFYYKGADVDDAARWLLEKASLQQIAQFNINDPKYDVASLFQKYPKRD